MIWLLDNSSVVCWQLNNMVTQFLVTKTSAVYKSSGLVYTPFNLLLAQKESCCIDTYLGSIYNQKEFNQLNTAISKGFMNISLFWLV